MTDLLFYTPFIAAILFMYGWSINNLVRAFREGVLWKEETVNVNKSLQDHLPLFSYELDGKKITSNRLSDLVEDGEAITFIYPKGFPEKAKVKESHDWPFNIVGLLFATVFAGFISWAISDTISDIKRTDASIALRATGKKIIIPASRATLHSSSGDSDHIGHYWLHVLWTDSIAKQTYEFESRQFYFDITDQFQETKELIIYVDPQNYRQYDLDVPFIPKVTIHLENPPFDESMENGGWVCLIFGLVLVSVSLFLLSMDYLLVQNGVGATAKILHLVTRNSSSGYVYSPFIQFKSEDEALVQMELPEATNPPSHKAGDEIRIHYERGNPANITTLNLGFMIFKSVLLFIGLALMMGGIYFFME